MSIELQIISLLVIFGAIALFVSRGGNKSTFDPPTQITPPKPSQPDDPDLDPLEPIYEGPVDRNGRREGDPDFDPRGDRPKDEFSPVPPYGAYYGEGPFDPTKFWVDSNGTFHRP